MRRLIVGAAAAACVLTAVPAATAATVARTGDTITYTADPGEANRLGIDRSPGHYRFLEGGTVTITPGAGCTGAAPAMCPLDGVARIRVLAGDSDDEVQVDNGSNPVAIPVELHGGDDDDQLNGGAGNDELFGDAGRDLVESEAGNDVLHGGDGPDAVLPENGTDLAFGDGGDDVTLLATGAEFFGGGGRDTVVVIGGGMSTPPITVTLDDLANDGAEGFLMNVHSDVEVVDGLATSMFSSAPLPRNALTLRGTDGPQTLRSADGADVLEGRGGIDVLESGGGNDTILARDGGPDSVACGDGTDTAVVDAVDAVSDCETVDRAPAPAPPAGAAPPQTVVVPAARVLARPRLRLSTARDRRAPYVFVLSGRLDAPAGTTCADGAVLVTVKRGRRTVRTTLATVRRTCTFTVRLRFGSRRGLGNGRLAVTARFTGNETLRAATSAVARIRLG